MKTLSLKLDDDIFSKTGKMTAELKMARNRYINEALRKFNEYNHKLAIAGRAATRVKGRDGQLYGGAGRIGCFGRQL